FAVLNQQVVIDAFGPEFVFDDGNTSAMVFGKNTLQQGCFARAQKTGKYGDRNHFVCFNSGFHFVPRGRKPLLSLPPGNCLPWGRLLRVAQKNSTCDYITAYALEQTSVC